MYMDWKQQQVPAEPLVPSVRNVMDANFRRADAQGVHTRFVEPTVPDFLEFIFDGVPYTRCVAGEFDDGVYDDELDEVGQWRDGAISFTAQGARLHTTYLLTHADLVE